MTTVYPEFTVNMVHVSETYIYISARESPARGPDPARGVVQSGPWKVLENVKYSDFSPVMWLFCGFFSHFWPPSVQKIYILARRMKSFPGTDLYK